MNKSLDNKIVLVTQTSKDYMSQVKNLYENKIK